MKLQTGFCLGLLALSFSAVLYAQDILLPEKSLHISGLIRQQAPSSPSGTVEQPVTIPNLLAALAISSTDKHLRYFYDQTTSSFVIADASGTAAPVATVFSFGPNVTFWSGTTGKNPSFVASGNQAAGLNGMLSGGFVEQETATKSSTSSAATVLLSGTVGSVDTLLQLRVTATPFSLK